MGELPRLRHFGGYATCCWGNNEWLKKIITTSEDCYEGKTYTSVCMRKAIPPQNGRNILRRPPQQKCFWASG